MSLLASLITLTTRYGMKSFGGFVTYTKSQVYKTTALTQQQLTAAWMIFLLNVYVFLIGMGTLILSYILFRIFLSRPAKTPRDSTEENPKTSSNESGAYTANTAAAALSAIAFTLALLGVAISSLSQVLSTTGSFLITLLPILAPLTGLFIFTTVVLIYDDTIFEFLNTANLNWIRPGFDYFLNPIITIVLLAYQTIYGGWVTILRIIAYFTYGPILVLLQCSFDLVPTLIFEAGNIAATLVFAIAYWVANNPIFAEIPLVDTFQSMGQFLFTLWTGPISCFCSVLNYVIGGIGKTFNDINLAHALSNFVNFIWVTPAAFIIRPIITNTAPQVIRVYQLQSGTLDSLGIWLENAFTFQLDVYIYGGNGTLVGMVNGSIPLPTDDLKYLVFFLRSEWVEMLMHAVNAVVAGLLWEPLNIAFQAPTVFSANGASVFQWNMVRNETIMTLNSLATVLDIAPLCANPGFSINFGSLISPFKAIVWLLQATSDILVGEFYSLIVPPGQVPGFFLASYLLQNAIPLMQFETEVNNTAEILGCILAYLDNSLGKSVEGLLSAFIIWIPRIPIQILAFVRYILQTGEVDVLDAVNIDQLEQAFLEIAVIGEIFFQFEPGATALTCPSTVSFFCAAGVATEKALSFLFTGIIIIARTVISLLKIVIQGIATQTLAQVDPPDFTQLLDDGYAVGCRLGVLLGTFIPLSVECMQAQPGFCKVLEFPGQLDNTISICLSTVLCKVGNLLIVPIDVFVTGVTYVVTFDFTNSSLVVLAVKQILNVLIFRILSPICPLAHFFDCVFDSIVGGGQTAATGFFCLITGALVFLFNTLSDVIVQLLQWIINVIIFIFGGFTQSDAAKVLVDLIVQFFTIVGTSLEKIFLALLNLVLSIFFSILVTICRIINFFIFFSITQQCNELEASLNNVLGGGATNFLGPSFTNYKRNAEEDITGVKADGCKRNNVDNLEMMSIQMLESIYERYPKLGRFGLLDSERARLGMAKRNTPDCDDSKKRTDSQSMPSNNTTFIPTSFYDQLINKTFGPGPTDPQQVTTYLFEQVHWDRTSNCYSIFKMLNGKRWDQTGAADRLMVYDCVKAKMIAVGLSNTFSVLSWLPEDIFYNTAFRSIVLGIGVARFTAVALNWASDRTVPYGVLMSNLYQDQWRAIKLDTSHYNGTFLPLYPGPNATPYQYAKLMQKIKSMTLQSYLVRNFPAIYNTSRLEYDPILQPIQDMYEFAGEFALDSLRGVYNTSAESLKANETHRYGPYYPTNGVYYFGRDLNNRTAIWLEYGDDALEAYDTRVSTLSLYDSLSSFFMGLWEWGGKFGNLLTNRNAGTNFKRTLESTSQLPFSIYNEYPRLKRTVVDKFGENMDRMLQDAPAFKRDTPRTVLVQSVETIGRLAAQALGSKVTAVPPWCIQFISKNTGIPYDQVLTIYEPNKTKLADECRDESWRQTLRSIGINNTMNGTSIWNDPFGFITTFLRPRTEQARINQDAIKNILSSTANSIWYTYYTIFGNDGTSMLDRMKKIQDDSVPSINDYIFNTKTETSITLKDALPQRIQSPRMRGYLEQHGLTNNGIPWQVVEDDYQLWKREQKLDEVLSSSNELKLFFFGETNALRPSSYSNTMDYYNGSMMVNVLDDIAIRKAASPNLGRWRNQLTRQSTEYLYRDYDMQVISAALKAQERNPKLAKQGLIFKPQSEKMLRDLGVTKELRDANGGVVVRIFSVFERQIEVSTEAQWNEAAVNNKQQNHRNRHNRQHKYRISTTRTGDGDADRQFELREDINKFVTDVFEPISNAQQNGPTTNYYTIKMHNIILVDNGIHATASFLNLTGILVKTCQTQITWLCENCYFLDQIVGLFVTRAVYIFNYYTGYYINLVADTTPYLIYTFTDNATVISGNGSNSPWIPALNEPLGTFFQFTQNEIDNGLSLTHWISYITGAPVPNLVKNGPFYELILNYTLSITPITPLQQNVMYDLLSFIEFTLGWQICELIDTIVAFFEEDIEGVADFAVHHLAFCTYTIEIDCSQQQYSFAGGAIVLFFYYFIGIVAATIVLQAAPYMTAAIFMTLVISFPFVHAVITYGWSVRCLAFPQCYFKDLWNLWVYTIYPKCVPVFGAFVTSGNYTADTCFNRTNTWEWANCQEIGFMNIFDSLAYFKLWLGGDLGLTATFTPLFEQYGLSTATTLDWNTTNWNTDPVLYRNFGGCSILTAAPYAIAGIALLLVAVTVAAALIAALPPLFAAIALVLFAAVTFAFFAIVEMNYSYVSRNATEAVEEQAAKLKEDKESLPPDGDGGNEDESNTKIKATSKRASADYNGAGGVVVNALKMAYVGASSLYNNIKKRYNLKKSDATTSNTKSIFDNYNNKEQKKM